MQNVIKMFEAIGKLVALKQTGVINLSASSPCLAAWVADAEARGEKVLTKESWTELYRLPEGFKL